MAIIALLTDYGTRDHYAAALKGVIAGIAPQARVLDITHDVAPGDIAQGAFVLWQSWAWFPPRTVFVAVVDPGVGSSRRILLGQYDGRAVVAPDNGLLTWLHRECRCEALTVVENRDYLVPTVSATFHGRDIMAPVAAHLSNGVDPSKFGPATDRVEELPIPRCAHAQGEGWAGQVIHTDHFGTLVTNIHAEQLGSHPIQAWRVTVNGASIGAIRLAFHEVAVGEPLAILGSSGFVEIAVNRGRAVDRFGPADQVRVQTRWREL